MIENIYHELILELTRHPLNKGVPQNFDISLGSHNRVCGDNLIFYVNFDDKNRVISANWDGDGCALSVSSASLFTEFIKGKTKDQIKKIKAKDVLGLLHMKDLNPSRLRCALLPLESFKEI